MTMHFRTWLILSVFMEHSGETQILIEQEGLIISKSRIISTNPILVRRRK